MNLQTTLLLPNQKGQDMSQQQSISLALMQLEQSFNNLQNGMFDSQGKLVPDKRWFTIYDNILTQIIAAREIADKSNQSPLTDIAWHKVHSTIKSS